MRPQLTLSLPREFPNRTTQDSAAISQLSSLILHPQQPGHAHWTRRNLVRRLERLIPCQFCFLIAYGRRRPRRGLELHLGGERGWLPFADVAAVVQRPQRSPTFLFLITDDKVTESELATLLAYTPDNLCVVWSSASAAREVVAIGCQAFAWWEMRSVFSRPVTAQYLAGVVTSLADAFDARWADRRIMSWNRMARSDTAWEEGKLLATSVDLQTIIGAARPEQVSDTVKRIADAAARKKTRHQNAASAGVSSQGLFWLCELAEDLDFDWFSATSLAEELYGPTPEARESECTRLYPASVGYDEAQGFLSDFNTVQSGVYPIGCTVDPEASEPPAHSSRVHVPKFRILRRPVTNRDWRTFVGFPEAGLDDQDLPRVECSAIDAMAFAKSVTTVLRRLGLIDEAEEVLLPTEHQWEIAARGVSGFDYPWGDTFEGERCNCDLVVGNRITAPGLFSPKGDSWVGCQDMAGNVREWTRSYGGVEGRDWVLYAHDPQERELATTRAADRIVIRGGSYSYDHKCVRTWVRNTQLASRKDGQTGFRLVIEGGL